MTCSFHGTDEALSWQNKVSAGVCAANMLESLAGGSAALLAPYELIFVS